MQPVCWQKQSAVFNSIVGKITKVIILEILIGTLFFISSFYPPVNIILIYSYKNKLQIIESSYSHISGPSTTKILNLTNFFICTYFLVFFLPSLLLLLFFLHYSSHEVCDKMLLPPIFFLSFTILPVTSSPASTLFSSYTSNSNNASFYSTNTPKTTVPQSYANTMRNNHDLSELNTKIAWHISVTQNIFSLYFLLVQFSIFEMNLLIHLPLSKFSHFLCHSVLSLRFAADGYSCLIHVMSVFVFFIN